MKITKSQLKQIIKEELEAIQEETPEQLVGELRTTLRQLRMGPGVHLMIEKAKNVLKKVYGMDDDLVHARDALDALNSIPEELLVDLSHLSRRDPERNQIRTALSNFLRGVNDDGEVTGKNILNAVKAGIDLTIKAISEKAGIDSKPFLFPR